MALLAEEDRVGFLELVDGGAFAAVDLGPVVTEAFKVVTLGNGGAFEDADSAAGEETDQGGPVVDLAFGRGAAIGEFVTRAVLGDGPGEGGDVAHEVEAVVDAVDRHVEQVTSAGAGLELSPAPTGFGPVEEALAAEVTGHSECAGVDEMPEVAHRGGEAVGEGGHVADVVPLRFEEHLAGFGEVEAQRFFAHDMLAGANAGESDGAMTVVGGGDDDGVDVGIGGDLFVFGGDFGGAPVGEPLLEEGLVGVAVGDEFGARIELDPGDVVVIGDGTGTDDGVADRSGHRRGTRGFWRR